MKKTTFLFIAMFCGIFSFAQTIPNAGFETWINNNESPHTYSVPQSWITVDAIQSTLNNMFGDATYVVNSVSQVAGHTGSSAVKMAVVQSNEGDTVSGAIISDPSVMDFFNVVFNGQGTLGFHYAIRSANLTGFRKFNSVGGDSAAIGVIMTKWNNATHSRDTIVDEENYYFTSGAVAWTAFSIPLSYLSTLTPDTCVIFASIVATNPHIGTNFTLDDLAFSGTVSGINEVVNTASNVKVFPNPFDEQTTFRFDDVQMNQATLEIFDVTGNKVRELTDLNGNEARFNREGLSAGIYFFHIINEGEIVAEGKLSIQ